MRISVTRPDSPLYLSAFFCFLTRHFVERGLNNGDVKMPQNISNYLDAWDT